MSKAKDGSKRKVETRPDGCIFERKDRPGCYWVKVRRGNRTLVRKGGTTKTRAKAVLAKLL